jgi:hypothetical protein
MSAKPIGRVNFSQQVDTKSIPRREKPVDPKISKVLEKEKLPRSPAMDFKRVFTPNLSTIKEGDEESVPEAFIVAGAIPVEEDNLPHESAANQSPLPNDGAAASQKTATVFQKKDQCMGAPISPIAFVPIYRSVATVLEDFDQEIQPETPPVAPFVAPPIAPAAAASPAPEAQHRISPPSNKKENPLRIDLLKSRYETARSTSLANEQ